MATIAEPAAQHRTQTFTTYAWGVLAWNFFVVLWGAYVRASGSGAGCGSHWPLCNGEVVPRDPQIATIIEFTHRVTSGIALVAVLGLAVWSVKLFPKDHRARSAALLSVVFLVIEALLGAGLVLLQLVGNDASTGRAFYLSLHLLNTQFLLASLGLTAWFSRDLTQRPMHVARVVAGALPVALLVSVTGAIAALGDTLYPASSLVEGIRQDVSGATSFLVRLRVAHPILAVLAAAYFISIAVTLIRGRSKPLTARIALYVLVLTIAQLCAGAINLVLLAPIPMQIFHLAIADAVWLSLVLLTVESGTLVSSS